MIELASKNNPQATFEIMDIRKICTIATKFDGIICGFCLPYLSQSDSENLFVNANNLLNDRGLIYISFVEGDPIKSGFQVSNSGDRSYFYYHTLEKLKSQLIANSFVDFKIFKVEYKKSETEIDIHTILTAMKTTQY